MVDGFVIGFASFVNATAQAQGLRRAAAMSLLPTRTRTASLMKKPSSSFGERLACRVLAAARLIMILAFTVSATATTRAPPKGVKITDMTADASGGLQAGVGIVDITPTTFPVALAGPPSKQLATTIDSRLYAKALVFATGGEKVAIVTLDSFKYELSQANNARQKIAAATGIPLRNITISASETHRAPFWNYYPDQLATPLTQAVQLALADLGPAKLAAAKGEADGVSENRRVIKGGTTWNRWVLPPSQQDRYTPEGPFDPTFAILAVVDSNERYKALLYNFACKGSNTRKIVVSADFPGDTEQYIQSHIGYGVPALFLNGPSGDIDPVAQDRAYPAEAQHLMGNRIGEAILSALPKLEPIADPSIKLETWELQMPGRENPFFPEADIKLKWPGQYRHFLADFNARTKIKKPSYPFSITGISIGNDFAIVTSPAEPFAKFGIDIKAQSPFKYTMVAIDTNGSYGYLPTREAFAGGGYETWYDLGSYLTTQAGYIDETYSVQILSRLKGLGATAN
jgi:neutral ceramidase